MNVFPLRHTCISRSEAWLLCECNSLVHSTATKAVEPQGDLNWPELGGLVHVFMLFSSLGSVVIIEWHKNNENWLLPVVQLNNDHKKTRRMHSLDLCCVAYLLSSVNWIL
jgi:hypothetical protein